MPHMQAFATTRAILPWSSQNVAIRIPSFFMFDFSALFTATVFSVVAVCLVFTMGAIFVALELEKLSPSLQNVQLLLGGFILPHIGNILFLPLLNVLLSTFVCSLDLEDTGEFFAGNQGGNAALECFTTQHITLMVISGISLVLYYPVVLRNLPVRIESTTYQ